MICETPSPILLAIGSLSVFHRRTLFDSADQVLELSVADNGGLKFGSVAFSGPGAYLRLRHEAGVHRVQRVPVTEKEGRIHTSTSSVVVMPEADEVRRQVALCLFASNTSQALGIVKERREDSGSLEIFYINPRVDILVSSEGLRMTIEGGRFIPCVLPHAGGCHHTRGGSADGRLPGVWRRGAACQRDQQRCAHHALAHRAGGDLPG